MNNGIAKGVSFDNIHSFNDLDLIFAGAEIPPATPKENYIDVPGADSSLDLTEALGEVKYNDRSGCKFTFTMNPEGDLSDEAFEAKKTEISNLLNGTVRKIALDKDPDYYYYGRCTVNGYAQDKKIKQFVISAKVKPYKYKQNETVFSVDLPKKASASGEIISVNDISPIEHELNVVLTSDTTTDFTGIKVSRYGKNLFGFTKEDFNNGENVGSGKKVVLQLKPNFEYTLSSDADGTHNAANIWFNGTLSDVNGVYNGASKTITTDSSGKVYILIRATELETIFTKNYIQLEPGKIATEYEPYKEPQTATATAEGMVEGLTSISPNMILFSDTEGVTINCEYEKGSTLKNGRKSVVPVITCTDDNTKVKFGDFETALNAGTHKVLNICLKQGNNEFWLSGTGTVTFTYQEGEL